jgi:hypothetical protein
VKTAVQLTTMSLYDFSFLMPRSSDGQSEVYAGYSERFTPATKVGKEPNRDGGWDVTTALYLINVIGVRHMNYPAYQA